MSPSSAADASALEGIVTVSRETLSRLNTFVALLNKWQKAENLVSASTLPDVWRRHVADSAQLVSVFPEPRRWLDLGSGAGFPGLIVALVGSPGTEVHLLESNRRKCAFLRLAIRETGAQARVHEGRVEATLAAWTSPVDRISARAVAPLPELIALAAPLMIAGVPAGFHKGLDFAAEVREATKSWSFDLLEYKSRIGEGVILDISNLRRRTAKLTTD